MALEKKPSQDDVLKSLVRLMAHANANGYTGVAQACASSTLRITVEMRKRGPSEKPREDEQR